MTPGQAELLLRQLEQTFHGVAVGRDSYLRTLIAAPYSRSARALRDLLRDQQTFPTLDELNAVIHPPEPSPPTPATGPVATVTALPRKESAEWVRKVRRQLDRGSSAGAAAPSTGPAQSSPGRSSNTPSGS